MAETVTPQSPLTPKEVEQIVQDQLARLLSASEQLVEKKVTDLENQAAAQKTEDLKKGKALNDFLEFTDFYSGQASAINRSLALAGVAIIWLFKKPPDATHPMVKGLLNTPLQFLILSLATDLFQYFFAFIAWRIFYEYKFSRWKQKNFDSAYAKDIEAPIPISLVIDLMFIAKIVFMILAFWNIFQYLRAGL
jgi:hypothetical protein